VRPALAAIAAGALVVGCSASVAGHGSDRTGGGGQGSTAAGANVLRYGYGPQKNGSFTYQPEVVLIDGGPNAIRSVSSDGLVWTMDGHAGGVRDLQPGKIMFAASDAAGRVVKVEARGADIAVTLAPVRLTDIVKDGHIKVDQDVSLDSLSFQGPADLPGAYGGEEDLSVKRTPTPSATAPSSPSASPSRAASLVQLPPLHLAATGGSEPPSQPPGGAQVTKKFGEWDVTAYKSASQLGLKIERGLAKDALKIAMDAHLDVANLHVSADVPVTAGEVGHSGFRLTGVTGVGVSIEGGAGNGQQDNRKVKIAFPIELKEAVIIGGFPATLSQKFKFIVETAFSAKNGNLKAAGMWNVDGPLGFDGTTLSTPTISAKDSLVESLSGVSVGVNAVVAAISFEFGLAVGLPVAGAGPYAKLITTVTLLNGSSIGIVQCKQTTFTATVKAGVGINIFSPAKSLIKKLLHYDIPEEKELLTKDVLKVSSYLPKVAVCSI